MTFEQLNLSRPILRALTDAGYEAPTPIQEQAIGPALEKRDLLGCAQTGTGKTAAFALPILQNISQAERVIRGKRPIRALILTPTRELALQIYESFRAYGRYLTPVCCVVFGGVSQQPQTEALRRGVDILVATPGRLNDLIGQGYISLSEVETFVLDEADRMLDMGFIHDVRRIITLLPPKRQTMLFSATMPDEIEQLANSILHEPVKMAVAPPATTAELIEQSVYMTDKMAKRKLLVWLLEDASVVSALVFTRTKHGADRVARELVRAGVEAQAIHGDKSQGARQTALSNFKCGKCRVLVATDIAARGIDIEELSHVVNYELPNVPETYVHRIGRTGRAGLSGKAVAFCDCSELTYLKDIEKLTHRAIPIVKDNPYPMTVFEESDSAPRTTRGRFMPSQPSDKRATRAVNTEKAARRHYANGHPDFKRTDHKA
ncbi:MAG: DEAD/DEAH box helicase [Oscillospiraceae bacterium]